MRVHMEAIHDAKVQLKYTPLSRRHTLLLCGVDNIRFRFRNGRIKTADLLCRRSHRQRHQQSRKPCTQSHHCPPIVAIPPEAITFLICASISSLLPSPAVSSTTTPFLST